MGERSDLVVHEARRPFWPNRFTLRDQEGNVLGRATRPFSLKPDITLHGPSGAPTLRLTTSHRGTSDRLSIHDPEANRLVAHIVRDHDSTEWALFGASGQIVGHLRREGHDQERRPTERRTWVLVVGSKYQVAARFHGSANLVREKIDIRFSARLADAKLAAGVAVAILMLGAKLR